MMINESKLCAGIVVIFAVLFMLSPVQADLIWGFESEDGVSAVGSGTGLTSLVGSLVTSPKTQGDYAAEVVISKTGGPTPWLQYQVQLPEAVDLTDQTISVDIYNTGGGIFNTTSDGTELRLIDGSGNIERWREEPTTPGGWVTFTVTENVGYNAISAGFDPSNVVAFWIGGQLTTNAFTDGIVYYDNFQIVPEPATMSLLAFGGLVGLIRRKRH